MPHPLLFDCKALLREGWEECQVMKALMNAQCRYLPEQVELKANLQILEPFCCIVYYVMIPSLRGWLANID